MKKLSKHTIFSIILVVFFIASLQGIFILLTRVCFKMKARFVTSQSDYSPIVRRITEAYLRLLIPQNFEINLGQTSVASDRLPAKIKMPIIQFEWTNRLSAYSEKPAKPFVRHAAMIFTPYVMYAPAPGTIHGDFPSMHHNMQQFRYPQDLTPLKDPFEIRIFITGGSTAWGCMAPNDEGTIAAFLERFLNNPPRQQYQIKVINAACGGWNTTEERIWILNRISEFQPDIIISYSGMNDIGNIIEDQTDLFAYIHNDAAYYYVGLREYDYYNRGEFAVKLMKNYSKVFYSPSDFPRKSLKNIGVIANYLKTIDCEYLYVLQPLNKKSSIIQWGYLPQWRLFAQTLHNMETDIPFHFIDHSDLFDQREELFVDSCHFGDLGYQEIAKKLLPDILPLIEKVIQKRKKQ